MSLLPFLIRAEPSFGCDWDRPMRIFGQNFGLGLDLDDLVDNSLRQGFYRPLRHLATRDTGVSSVTNDKEKFQVSMDVQQFKPTELSVKNVDNTLIIEGKHEERQDEHGFISRQFVRKYAIPNDIQIENMVSKLSSDGVLTITAPKKALEAAKSQDIPIVQTGLPAAKPQPANQSGDAAKKDKSVSERH